MEARITVPMSITVPVCRIALKPVNRLPCIARIKTIPIMLLRSSDGMILTAGKTSENISRMRMVHGIVRTAGGRTGVRMDISGYPMKIYRC